VTDFQDDAKLDPGQVEDQRGRRAGGRPLAIGGGGLGLVIVIITLLLGGNPFGSDANGNLGGLGDLNNSQVGEGATSTSDVATACLTGADAERREDCRAIGYVNSIQTFWEKTFGAYTPAVTVFFDSDIDTGCGRASPDVGPFYCPRDKKVYIDLGFLAELRDRFGATGGPFAQGYIIAHEYGHHVQDLLGTLDQVAGDTSGPQSKAVRSELQADCYAGAWAANAVKTGFIAKVSDADIATALDAASAVGDDRIQKATQGQVNQESWTHGSSAQRVKWFKQGFTSQDPNTCDTFSGSI
jgi:predicted metalloprotease